MLDINSLLVISFITSFSHSVACLFILSMVPLAYFCFYFFCFGDRSEKTLLLFVSKSFLPRFSPRSFMVSGLIFRSLIHFEGFFFLMA